MDHCFQRADDTLVEDEGWHAAAARYQDFVRRHRGSRLLLLEIGAGGNTPVFIKYHFWQMAAENPRATYACVSLGEAMRPRRFPSGASLSTWARQIRSKHYSKQ